MTGTKASGGGMPAGGKRPGGRRGGEAARPARPRNLTGLELLAASMPENGGRGSLEYAVTAKLHHLAELVRARGGRLMWQHNADSRRAHAGWPDWVIGGPGGVIYRELKRQGKNPTADQQTWLDLLTAAGHDAAVWRPADLYSGRIDAELAAVTGLPLGALSVTVRRATYRNRPGRASIGYPTPGGSATENTGPDMTKAPLPGGAGHLQVHSGSARCQPAEPVHFDQEAEMTIPRPPSASEARTPSVSYFPPVSPARRPA